MSLYIVEKSSQKKPLENALKEANIFDDVEIVELSGHIMTLYDFNEYDKNISKNWCNDIANKKIPFFPDTLKKKIKPNSSYIKNGKVFHSNYKNKFDEVKKSIDKHNKIILATDPDNEGANLGLEVIEMCNALDKVVGMINMSKLDLYSLSKEVNKIDKLDYKTMSDCGDARAYFDQMFGYNLTRITTCYLSSDKKILQVGGVKLPVIRMVVERDEAFEKHKKIPFYSLIGKAKYQDEIFDINVVHEDFIDGKFDNRDFAEDLKKELIDNNANIIEFTEKNSYEAPPKPFSLTSLQSEANKRFKMTAEKTLDAAQSLYVLKMQSYPRTDSNFYSEGEYNEASKLLNALSCIKEFKHILDTINTSNELKKRKIFDDTKVTAHTALSPTSEIDFKKFSKLNEDELNIFKLVAVAYMAQFLEDYNYLKINGVAKVSDKISIKFNQNVGISKGWKIILDDFTMNTRNIPNIPIGDSIEIVDLKVKESFTKPKPRFNEANLLISMEQIHRYYDDKEIKKQLGVNGIGTPATRASIIKDLKTAKKNDESYLIVKNNTLISTQKARDLIKKLPEYVSSPLLRAKMEANLKKILNKEITKEQYYNEVKKIVTNIADDISKLGVLSKQNKAETKETNLLCPLCNNKILDTENTFKCKTNIFQNDKQKGCKFFIIKNQKLFNNEITEKSLSDLLNNKILVDDKQNKLELDLKNKFFTKITFSENHNYQSKNSNKLIKTAKTFRLGDKFCFINCFGKNLTEKQAEKILNGEKIKLKRYSNKTGNDYEVTVSLGNNGKFESSFS